MVSDLTVSPPDFGSAYDQQKIFTVENICLFVEKYRNFFYGLHERFSSSSISISLPCRVETSDFDAQMSGIKFWKGDENLRPVDKKLFYKIMSGCLHEGLF
jgi:hypothetical protein